MNVRHRQFSASWVFISASTIAPVSSTLFTTASSAGSAPPRELCTDVMLQSQPGLPGGSVLRVPVLLQSDE